MKAILGVLCCCLAMPVLAATELVIAPGQTYTVPSGAERMVLSALNIGDGATVRLGPGVSQWQVRAERAEIGRNVTIDASGASGRAGSAGSSAATESAEQCANGQHGEPGERGQQGADGRAVRMQLGLVALGSMSIVSDGGNGGDGGRGGKGQDAASSDGCKHAPRGGNAGNAGAGGNGGMGGDVSVVVWAAQPSLDISRALNAITTSSKGGQAGAGATPGAAGAGSKGRYIKKKTLTGNRTWQEGGKAGLAGEPGQSGRNGLNGRTLVEQALVAATVVSAPVSPVAASQPLNRDQEIAAIKQQLQELTRRIQRLEK